MKNKKLLIIVSFLLIAIISFVFINQRQTTYGKLLESNLEGETISEIRIRDYNQNEDREMTLNSPEEISNFTMDISHMELNRTGTPMGRNYIVSFHTVEGYNFSMSFDDNGVVRFPGENYDFEIQGDNQLLKILNSFDDKWNNVN